MKRETIYLVTIVCQSDEQDSYADPYGRTCYTREKESFDDRKKAEAYFQLLKKTKQHAGHRVKSAKLEHVTVTLMEDFK